MTDLEELAQQLAAQGDQPAPLFDIQEPTAVPHYEDDTVTLHAGDCLDVLRAMPDASVHAVVTDPPYGLSDHKPEHVTAALTAWISGDREHVPNGAGFMSKTWDSFVPPPAIWDECLRVLKPGGHLLVFAAPRTMDLMGLSIRLAGFEIRDSIGAALPPLMAWTYGQGMPKGQDVGKAIDATLLHGGANSRRIKTVSEDRPLIRRHHQANGISVTNDTQEGHIRAWQFDVTAPATPEAAQWEGWNTSLKPSWEPVLCAQKPFNPVVSSLVISETHHGLGALLWLSASPARRAELTSPSAPHALPEGACASALAAAVPASSPGRSEATATYSSPALASTSSNIASSWSAILGALSDPTRTFTTSTASSTTTALKTLNSLLAPITSPTTMPRCECLLGGRSSPALSVEASSSDAWARWRHTLSASAPESAIEGIALAVSSALASVAAELSSEPVEGSTAPPSATTASLGESSTRESANTAERTTSRAGASDGTAHSGAQGSPSISGGSRPSWEPIIVARKPFPGTVAANVMAHGVGAYNVDACRVAGTPVQDRGERRRLAPETVARNATGRMVTVDETMSNPPHAAGRWPSNVVLVHAEPEGEPCQDGCPVAEMDRQSGITKTGAQPFNRNTALGVMGDDAWQAQHQVAQRHPGEGGASRFFPVFKYQAKAPSRERPRVNGVAHVSVKPLELMKWLARLVCPPGGTILDPFAGSGTTLEAGMLEGFHVIGVERQPEYLPLIEQRIERAHTTLAAQAGKAEALFDTPPVEKPAAKVAPVVPIPEHRPEPTTLFDFLNDEAS